MAGGMLFPPSYYGPEFTPAEEAAMDAGQARAEAIGGEQLLVCLSPRGDFACGVCARCVDVAREWDEHAEAAHEAAVEAYAEARGGGW